MRTTLPCASVCQLRVDAVRYDYGDELHPRPCRQPKWEIHGHPLHQRPCVSNVHPVNTPWPLAWRGSVVPLHNDALIAVHGCANKVLRASRSGTRTWSIAQKMQWGCRATDRKHRKESQQTSDGVWNERSQGEMASVQGASILVWGTFPRAKMS